jgi:parvulin-like peptidyl-prolyl isomerase
MNFLKKYKTQIRMAVLTWMFVMACSAPANATKSGEEPMPSHVAQGVKVGTEKPKVVLLTVNGNEITAKDYAEYLQRNAEHIGVAVNSPEARVSIIRQLVGGQLLKEKMKQDGVLNENLSSVEQSAALQKYANEHFPLPKTVDESVAYQYYQEHKGDFGIPEMVRVSQIQFLAPEGSSEQLRAEAKLKADAALKRLQAGEPFPKLAAELTENPLGKVPEGDLGYLAIGATPWLQKSLDGIAVGKYTGVLESPAGFEILMVTDIRPAVITPYPNAREKVMQRVKVAEQQRLRDEYVATLGRTAKIEFKDADIKKLFPNGLYP